MNPTTFAMAAASYSECSLVRTFLVARVRPRVDEKVASQQRSRLNASSRGCSCPLRGTRGAMPPGPAAIPRVHRRQRPAGSD
jgi:hypothetical protein